MAITTKQKEQFIDLRSEGLSFNSISKELGISKPTLINLHNEFEKEIKNLTFLKVEELSEKYQLGKKERFESNLKELKRIDAEIVKRDLSEITFKELILYKKTLDENLRSEMPLFSFSTGIMEDDALDLPWNDEIKIHIE